jgi:hypothetical protein
MHPNTHGIPPHSPNRRHTISTDMISMPKDQFSGSTGIRIEVLRLDQLVEACYYSRLAHVTNFSSTICRLRRRATLHALHLRIKACFSGTLNPCHLSQFKHMPSFVYQRLIPPGPGKDIYASPDNPMLLGYNLCPQWSRHIWDSPFTFALR